MSAKWTMFSLLKNGDAFKRDPTKRETYRKTGERTAALIDIDFTTMQECAGYERSFKPTAAVLVFEGE
jgi:hypothetical protein